MFAKGPRFHKTLVSDTPGPTDYNPQEPVFDAYKRGAFLEQADRFKDIESESPPPDMNRTKPTQPSHRPGAPSVGATDRYALLQRKVDDLEHVHQEWKKAHLADVERLKAELAKYQKYHMDNTDVVEKQKRHSSLLEARIKDLKKVRTSDETELNEARLKLRSLESERNRLHLNTSEAQDLKTSLQALENKRRDELRERDRRISELEKSLAEEKKARESLSGQHHQLKKTSEAEIKQATRKLQLLVDQKSAEASKLQQDLARIKESSSSKEDEAVHQLEQHRDLLSQVASEFGKLAAQSVQKSHYTDLQNKHHALQLQNAKLGRRLAGSEAQVAELVHLIRQIQTDNVLISQQLDDAMHEISLTRDLVSSDETSHLLAEFVDLSAIQDSIRRDQLISSKVDHRTAQLLGSFYRHRSAELAVTARLLHQELTVTDAIAEQHATHVSEVLASHEAIAAQLDRVSTDYAKTREQLGRAGADKACVERDLRNLTMKVEEKEALLAGIEPKHKQALKKERDTIQRLTSTIQKNRIAEDALREEINKLTEDLQSLEYYSAAYTNLTKEINLLASLNKIAEEEATQLSQCNAEILGHHNPAQRIMYVDRIRRELAEAKTTIAELQLEKEEAEQQGEQFKQELKMYTSVMVPVGSKPRTNMTRVARVPLANVAESLNKSPVAARRPASRASKDEVYSAPDDLTMDELM